ncbi:MAG: four helix bundle protein [Gemmatimonadaceae bacterium]
MPHSKGPLRKRDLPESDSLHRMRAYQLARELVDVCWDDAEALVRHPLTANIGPQLYEAACSIAVNLSEGYSRSSGRDRARIFEYALGSARESIDWYNAGARVLAEDVVAARVETLVEIRKILRAVIPRERDRTIRPNKEINSKDSGLNQSGRQDPGRADPGRDDSGPSPSPQ